MKSVIGHHILGDVIVSQSWRSKRISISVRPPDVVCLSLPYNVPLTEAIKFLDSKIDWVEHARTKMQTAHPQTLINMPFSTRWHSLYLNPMVVAKISVRITEDRVVVTYPIEDNYTGENVQEAIKKGVEQAWKAEALELLPSRTEEIARSLGLQYRSVSVRNTRSKWGSCSSRNDLSLSIHLMRLPDHLVDYIIIHELCHTVHKDHSSRFHSLLDRLTGGRDKELNREMKKFHTRW